MPQSREVVNKRPLVSRALLCVVVLLAVAVRPAEAQDARAMAAATAAFYDADYARAAQLFERVAQVSRSPVPNIYLARMLMARHRSDSALVLLEGTVASNDSDPDAHLWLAKAYMQQAAGVWPVSDAVPQWVRARNELARAAKLNPDDQIIAEALLEFHATAPAPAGGSLAQATKDATTMARFGAYAHEFWTAWVIEKSGDIEDAERRFRQLTRTYPDSAEPEVRLLNILVKERQIDEVYTLLDSRLAERPDDATALYALGQLGSGGRRPVDAERALRRFLQHPVYTANSSPAGAHYFLGRALLSQHRDDEAADEFRAAIRIDDRTTLAWQALTAMGKTFAGS